MAYSTATDWIDRFHAAGGSMIVDAATMRPVDGQALSPELEAIWAEIRGHENRAKWDEVEAEVRFRVGPFIGWVRF